MGQAPIGSDPNAQGLVFLATPPPSSLGFWQAMMGALPCTAPAFKGIRLSLSCCWNAAATHAARRDSRFGVGFLSGILQDRHGERPFDMASNDETRAVLEAPISVAWSLLVVQSAKAWDVSKTDTLKEACLTKGLSDKQSWISLCSLV